MTNREKPFSSGIELSPPVRRFPDWPPDENIPSILNENAVYLEAGASAGYRDNLYQTVAMFIYGGMFSFATLMLIGSPWEFAFFYFALPCFVLALFFLIGTILTPSSLPLRVNRQTRELYYVHNHQLYKAPWDDFQARAVFMSSTVATGANILWFILHREGDQKPLSVAVGGGRSQEHALRHWEYFCLYMENGTPVSILVDVPEDQKCQVRKNWETPMAQILGILASYLFYPHDLMANYFERLSLRPNLWPEEVIAVCEKHPILQTPEGRASMITDPRAKFLQAREEREKREIQTRTAQPRTREKTWAEIEKRGDFQD
ncbi:DUF6708 domain-containing protein [Geoalkalibacter halelectricus]|uniref:DUF6708 domain-containing protein n=1 Tax=Geoalkalibacter halelectricus TaxID=2847045 RepID=UPI003D20473B